MDLFRKSRCWILQSLGRGRLREKDNASEPSSEPSTAASLGSFEELTTELQSLVENGERQKSERLLREVRRRFPVPAVDILPKNVWGTAKDQLVLRRRDIAEAIGNVELTGRKLTDEEKDSLKVLAFHWCAWSPTAAEHRNDSILKL
jgi:hypothetical protein